MSLALPADRTLLKPTPTLLTSCHCDSLLAMTERIAHIGSWTVKMPSHQLVYSAECAVILDVPAGRSMKLDDLVELFTPEWRTRMALLVQTCRQSGASFDEEMQIDTGAGLRKWVRATGEATRDKNGQIFGLQGALQDISAQKKAQQETARLAMRLTTTLASITEAFVTLDPQCCFTYLNQESEQLLRHTSRELLGKEVWEVLVNNVGQRLRQQLQKSVATGRPVEFEDFYPALGKWIEVRAYPFTEGLAVYFRDVSTRRKSQEHLMLLETCISRLSDIVVIAEALPTNKQVPYIVFVNEAFERHTGYSRRDVIGQTPQKLLGPELLPGELQRISAALKHKRQAASELVIYRKDGSCFWLELEIVLVQAQPDEVKHWVAVGRDITQRKGAADAIHQLAYYDPLTGLPNRLMLLTRLEQVLAQNTSMQRYGVLMFIDVDKLKLINDTLGHHKGDQLLQQVAARLQTCVEATDTVARLGGDEFVVMLENLDADASIAALKARVLADKVLAQLREPFDLGGYLHYTTSSIGVTSLNGQQDSVSEVLKQADLAMYQAKTTGRNTLCFFDPVMQAAVNASAAVSSDLHLGLRERQFLLYYQPQLNYEGQVTGVEALLRWRHPKRGLVEPADFIPMAEETGLILPLGQWALATACDQLAAWAASPQTAGLSISVNVSVRQFRHPEFVDGVMAQIKRTGIAPQRLRLELTESLLADGMEITLAKMGTLKALGVTMALDDFGTGYSSLSALKSLPLDQIKIDRCFVADVLSNPHDAAIARAIITLAHSLGLEVMAEGVETLAQRDFLVAEGCHQFQGFLYSRPLPIDQLEPYLVAQLTA